MRYQNLNEKELSLLIDAKLEAVFGTALNMKYIHTSDHILSDYTNFWNDTCKDMKSLIGIDVGLVNTFYDECIKDRKPDTETLNCILAGLEKIEKEME